VRRRWRRLSFPDTGSAGEDLRGQISRVAHPVSPSRRSASRSSDPGLADALHGGRIYHRLLISHQPLSAEYARTVVDEVFVGFKRPEALPIQASSPMKSFEVVGFENIGKS
jgi:hypothetical protein